VRPRHRREDIIYMDLKEVAVKVWTEIGWLRMCLVASSFKHIEEALSSTKGREFLDQLSDCRLLKNNFSVKLLM
jgi:hypothetical protein